MATLPLQHLLGEPLIVSDQGIVLDPARSGIGRGEALFDEAQYTVELHWPVLEGYQRDQISEFVRQHRVDEIELDLRGYRYRLYLVPGGGPDEQARGPYYTMRMTGRGPREPVLAVPEILETLSGVSSTGDDTLDVSLAGARPGDDLLLLIRVTGGSTDALDDDLGWNRLVDLESVLLCLHRVAESDQAVWSFPKEDLGGGTYGVYGWIAYRVRRRFAAAALIVGSNAPGGSAESIDCSDSPLDVPANALAIAVCRVNNAISDVAFGNGYTIDVSPFASWQLVSASRTYPGAAAAQNTTATWTSSSPARRAALLVLPNSAP